MAVPNLFEELKTALTEFKTFLDTNVAVIKPVINALAALIPQINELVNLLVGLITDLKAEIQKLDVNAIPNMDKVGDFTGKVTNLLGTMKTLLPDQAGPIDEVLGVAQLAGSLTSLDAIKVEILGLIDAIIAHLNSLKA